MDWLEMIEENQKKQFQNGLENGLWDDSKDYPLAVAAENGRHEIVQMLLKRGADPCKEHEFLGDSVTPLHAAVGAWSGGNTHYPSTYERLRVVKLLLDAGADVNGKLTGFKSLCWTPLHCLAGDSGGQPEVARLLYDYGADLDAEDLYGHTPIHFARNRRNEALAKQLAILARTRPARRGGAPSSHPKVQRIRFRCPNCDKPVTVPAQHAGKRGKCPGCATVVQIPHCDLSSRVEEEDPQQSEQRHDEELGLKPVTVGLRCNCGQTLHAMEEYARKPVKCPGCGRVHILPAIPGQFLFVATNDDYHFLRAAPLTGCARSGWTLQQYAQAIADKVTNTTPCEDSGLERHRTYVRTVGQEISDQWGFSAMQQVWDAIHDAMGPGPCSDLTRIWDGVGQWQK